MRRDREGGYRREIKGEIKEEYGRQGEMLKKGKKGGDKRKSWGGTEREVIEGEERRR